MLLITTRLGSSPLHGLGLFAAEPIPAGTEIWRFTPRFDLEFPKSEVQALPTRMREFIEHYGYLDARLGLWVICFDNARFMNHSDTPNTRPDYALDPHGVDIALRTIGAGEEITTDYRLLQAAS
jgi:SET domain-containing protein